MKKLLILIFSLLPFVALADDDRPVSFEELPSAAREFIRKHFPQEKITLATVDREFMDTTYDVIFTDGTKIEFDFSGEWKEIDCRGSFVPAGGLLPEIAAFISDRFPGARVRDIERDRRGYELNLDNHAELRFNLRGAFRGYDD